MNEAAKKFIREKVSEELQTNELSVTIREVRKRIAHHEDFDTSVACMEAIADFKIKLLESFSEDDLIQIPAYHELIGSGIAENTVFAMPVPPLIAQRVVSAIARFINEELNQLLV